MVTFSVPAGLCVELGAVVVRFPKVLETSGGGADLEERGCPVEDLAWAGGAGLL